MEILHNLNTIVPEQPCPTRLFFVRHTYLKIDELTYLYL